MMPLQQVKTWGLADQEEVTVIPAGEASRMLEQVSAVSRNTTTVDPLLSQ